MMMTLLKTTVFPSHEVGTLVIKRLKEFLGMHILFLLVHQHRTFEIELEAKKNKTQSSDQYFFQNTDNRDKKIVSSCCKT